MRVGGGQRNVALRVDRAHDVQRVDTTCAVKELAVGTGRIVLPLAARGIRVDGVDLSPAMVAKLRAKPGGEDLQVTMGDFADVPVEGTHRLDAVKGSPKPRFCLRPNKSGIHTPASAPE